MAKQRNHDSCCLVPKQPKYPRFNLVILKPHVLRAQYLLIVCFVSCCSGLPRGPRLTRPRSRWRVQTSSSRWEHPRKSSRRSRPRWVQWDVWTVSWGL